MPRSLAAALLCLLLVLPAASAVPANDLGAEAEADLRRAALSALGHLDSASDVPGIRIGLAYEDPVARGVAGILDVTLTARGGTAHNVALLIAAPPSVLFTAVRVGELGTLVDNASITVRYLVTARDVGVHALTFRAVSTGSMSGERQAWLNVTTLAAATLMVDYRTDEPALGGDAELAQAPRGGDATDETPEEPDLPALPWPAPRDEDAGIGAFASGASSASSGPLAPAAEGTFTARLCWNFEDPETNLGEEWLRARWVNYRIMAEIPGPDRQLAQGLTGKDGCAVVSGLPRTVNGAPTRAYFMLRTCNGAACVVDEAHAEGYAWQTSAKTIGSMQTVLDWGDRVPTSHLYAGRIYARAMNGWSWFVNVGQTPKSIVPMAEIRTPSQPYGGGTYMSWEGPIYIEVNGDADVAEETVLHEYAHFWHWQLLGWFPSDAGGKHWLCDPAQKKGLAWTEGFGYFAAARANFDLGKLGVPGASGDAAVHTYGIESNACGNDLQGMSPKNSQNEFRVARALWDLTDSANDGFDVGPAASLQDLLLLVRTCGGLDIRDFIHAEDCSWKQAGKPMCTMLRAAHQNIYDSNEPPTADFPGLPEDRWVHGDVVVSAVLTDDGGIANCPLTTRFVASPSSFCPEDFVIGSAAGSQPSAVFETTKVFDQAYYLCSFASDGLETRAQISQVRYLVDNTGPRIVLGLQEQAWYNTPPSMPSQCVDDGVGYENAFGNRRIRIDNGTWDAQASFASVTTEGHHWGEVECYDRFGNRGVRGFSLNYDRTDPVLTFTTSPAPFDRDLVTVTITCADALSGCSRVRHDGGGPMRDYTGPFNLTTLETVDMWAVDRAGNIVELFPELGVERDAPVVSILNSSHTEALSLPGWHWSEPTITIDCEDAISGVGGIVYRINNGLNATYMRPFSLGVQGVVDISATCRDGARNTANATKTVKVDTLPPTTAYTLNGTMGNAGWYRSNVTLTIQCADDGAGIGRVDHRLDNGTWTVVPTATPVATLAFDGARWLDARCVDRVGHDVERGQQLRIDRVAPMAATAMDAVSPANRSVLVSVACVDPGAGSGCGGVAYRVNGGAWTQGSLVTLTTEGSHTVEAQATDIAGNVGPIASRTMVIDLRRPVLDVQFNGTMGANGWYTSSVLMSATCTDAGTGVAAREYRLNGGSWTAFATNVSFGVSGARTLDVRCADAAGNEIVHTSVLRIDRLAPTTTLVPAVAGWTNLASVNVDATCADQASGCNLTHYRIDGGPWAVLFADIVVSGEGEHLVEARSTDHAGLVGATASASVRIDRTAPTVNATLSPAAPANGWYANPPTGTASCIDAASGPARLETGWGDGALVPYAGAVTLAREGIHEWVARCTDAAGNSARSTVFIRLDLTAPTTTVNAPAGWWRTNVTVTVACADAGSGCLSRKARIDGGAWQTLGASGMLNVTAEGEHLVEAMSTDVAGHNSTIASAVVRIDRTAPSPSVRLDAALPSSGWYRAVNASASCDDALSGVNTVSAGYRNGTLATYTAPVALTVAGNHEWQARCTDAAGNVATTGAWVRLDPNAPTLVFNATVSASSFVFEWNVTDPLSGLAGNITVEEIHPRGLTTVVCSQAASGAARSGRCSFSGEYELRCYRLRATDAAGSVALSDVRCLELLHE